MLFYYITVNAVIIVVIIINIIIIITVNANHKKAGEGDIVVQIDQGAVPYKMQQVSRDIYRVFYISNTDGTRHIDVFFNKYPVPGMFICYFFR